MPNIKSAEKRVKIIDKKTQENKAVKSKIATYIKKFKLAILNKDVATSEIAFEDVVSLLDKAATANVIHKNSADRRKAHFAKMLDDLKKETK